MGLGDAMQQTIEKSQKKKRSYDWQRVAHMAAVGLVLGPVVHYWYGSLDRWLPGTQRRTIVKKVLADQLVASPVFLLIFFMGLGTLEGQVAQDSLKEFKTKFPVTWLVEWMFWPPAQAVNFYLLPPQYRVVYVNMLILVWDSFLSYMKHNDQVLTLPMPRTLTNPPTGTAPMIAPTIAEAAAPIIAEAAAPTIAQATAPTTAQVTAPTIAQATYPATAQAHYPAIAQAHYPTIAQARYPATAQAYYPPTTPQYPPATAQAYYPPTAPEPAPAATHSAAVPVTAPTTDPMAALLNVHAADTDALLPASTTK